MFTAPDKTSLRAPRRAAGLRQRRQPEADAPQAQIRLWRRSNLGSEIASSAFGLLAKTTRGVLLGALSDCRIVKGVLVFGAVLMLAVPSYADTSYLRNLVDQPSTTFSDGVFMITSFLEKADERSDFTSQKKFLEEQGILSVKLSEKKEDEILRRSELAEMAIRTLGIKGGLFLRLTGAFNRRGVLGQAVFRRYACNEAVFLKLMKPGDMRAAVTGQELISVVSRMSEYQSAGAG